MSSVVVVTPLIVAGWPVITAAVTAAVGSLGFSVVRTPLASTPKLKTRAEIDIEDSEILQESASIGGEIVIERDGLRAVFSRDTRGSLKLCIEGENHSKAELKQLGQDLLNRVTQQYVYHRIVSELHDRHMTIVDEQLTADRTVKLRVRNL
jgi:hypothetical protein